MPNAQKKTGLKLDESMRSPAGYVRINWVWVCAISASGCFRQSFFALASFIDEHWYVGWLTFGWCSLRYEELAVVAWLSVSEVADAESSDVWMWSDCAPFGFQPFPLTSAPLPPERGLFVADGGAHGEILLDFSILPTVTKELLEFSLVGIGCCNRTEFCGLNGFRPRNLIAWM